MLQAIKENGESYDKLMEEEKKLLKDISINTYAQDKASTNVEKITEGRTITGDTASMTEEAQTRASALSV
jgi:hypothetical protein